MLKGLIFLTAFSQIFLSRFGFQVGETFSLAPSYIFLYAALITAIAKGLVFIDLKLLIIFSGVVLTSFVSFLFGEPEKTFTSLILYWFIYFPFVFKSCNTASPALLFYNLYYPFFLLLAVFGLLQFGAQFFFNPDWLFDFRHNIPDFFQNKNTMNTVILLSGLTKSNGFFCLEPSFFSQYMSYGLLFAGLFGGSLASVLLLLCGLVVSFSGTGVIILITGCCVLFRYFTPNNRIFIFLALFIFFLISFLTKDNLLLSRVEEFKGGTGVRTTSAAMRFLNPRITVAEGLSRSTFNCIFGIGPGTISKVFRDFEGHDPVWAKLFFEYGILGGLLLIMFLFFSARTSSYKDHFLFLFFIQWSLLGGHLLNFDVISFYFVYYKLAILMET